MTTLINTEELASNGSTGTDPIQLVHEAGDDSIQEVNNFGSKPVTSSSDTSSSPTSPSYMNPLTPERQHSPPHDNAVIVTAMNEHSTLEDHFPNPYDDFPPFPYTHTRIHSAPPMQGLLHPGYQQPLRRTPSILRPSHPKAFDTIGSRRASLVLSAVDFDNSPLAPLGLGREARLSMHSTPSLHMDEESLISAGYSITPWQPRRSSPLTVPTTSPSSIDDQHQGDDEPHIEVSERFMDEPPSDAGSPEMPPPTVQTPKRQASGSWPGGIPVLKGGVKKTPRWKFWARRSRKIPNKS